MKKRGTYIGNRAIPQQIRVVQRALLFLHADPQGDEGQGAQEAAEPCQARVPARRRPRPLAQSPAPAAVSVRRTARPVWRAPRQEVLDVPQATRACEVRGRRAAHRLVQAGEARRKKSPL